MLEIKHLHTVLEVSDKDHDNDVEIQVSNSLETAYIYLNQDEIKQLIDHLNKQIS